MRAIIGFAFGVAVFLIVHRWGGAPFWPTTAAAALVIMALATGDVVGEEAATKRWRRMASALSQATAGKGEPNGA